MISFCSGTISSTRSTGINNTRRPDFDQVGFDRIGEPQTVD